MYCVEDVTTALEGSVPRPIIRVWLLLCDFRQSFDLLDVLVTFRGQEGTHEVFGTNGRAEDLATIFGDVDLDPSNVHLSSSSFPG